MNLSDLRYLCTLAEVRHFGRAAASLAISQPTLSVAIKRLEQSLDVILFERGAGEVRVTEAGERLVAQAQRVLDEVLTLQESARQWSEPLKGDLRLGAIYTIAPYLLPRLMTQLRARAPDMPLYLSEGYTADLGESLKCGEIDVAILALPYEAKGIVTWAVYDEPFRVLVPDGHPWCSEKSVDASWLAGERLLILGEGNCFRDQVVATHPGLSEKNGLQQAMEGSSLETIRAMVIGGLGVTVLPATAAKREEPGSVTLRFQSPEPFRRVALAWRASYPRPAAIEAVRQAMLACGLPGVASVAGEEEPVACGLMSR